MPEEDLNNIGTIEELKQINPWLNAYDLSDAEIYPLMTAIGEVIWGDIDLDEFWQKLSSAVKKDPEIQKKMAVTIARKRFMDFKDDIGDLDGFISKMGGAELESVKRNIPAVMSAEDINYKLSQYDWSKVVGIERRALLEELGVSLKDFVKWLGEKK